MIQKIRDLEKLTDFAPLDFELINTEEKQEDYLYFLQEEVGGLTYGQQQAGYELADY